MPSPYDIIDIEPIIRLPKSSELSDRLHKYSLRRNNRIQKDIQNYSNAYPQYLSIHTTHNKSMKLETQLHSMSNTSSMRLTSSAKLEEFIEKMKVRREKQKQALQVCMNNYEISVVQSTEIAKNNYSERASRSRARTKRLVMPKIEVVPTEKENKKTAKLQKLLMEETTNSHFRVHTILMDKSKYQKLNELIEVGQFSSRTINLLKSIKAQNI